MATGPVDPHASEQEEEDLAPLAGTRAQRIQRLQVGLFGLAAIVLLVALANVFADQAKVSEAAAVPEAAPTTEPEQMPATISNPLAEAGVVPEMPINPSPSPTPTAGNEANQGGGATQ
jgi:hypothetical protein